MGHGRTGEVKGGGGGGGRDSDCLLLVAKDSTYVDSRKLAKVLRSFLLSSFRFHSALTPVYFRRADAFVIVYDVSDRASFKNTKSWLSVISVSSAAMTALPTLTPSPPSHPHTLTQAALREHPPVVMLVGNKCDRADSRQVSLEEGRKLALVRERRGEGRGGMMFLNLALTFPCGDVSYINPPLPSPRSSTPCFQR